MRARRLTDIGKIYGKLFDQGIAKGNFLALLPVGQDHFVQGIPEHGPAVFQVPAFGEFLTGEGPWPVRTHKE